MTFPFGYLLDENINLAVEDFLTFHHPELPIHRVGAGIAPPKSTPDQDVLIWCENHGCILVTDNRKSMPGHLADHVAAGRHIEGIFQVGNLTVVELGEHLAEVIAVSFPGEYRDAIHFLPIT